MTEVHWEPLRQRVRDLMGEFPDEYWQDLDINRRYPEEFVRRMTETRLLAALIPEQYGGLGMSLTEASVILEEVNACGGNAGPAHAQMYVMGTVLRHGSDEQKAQYLPKIASGEVRLQAFGVTEPEAGTDTTQISTFAERHGDRFIVNGRKIYISRVPHSDLMVLLVRTTPKDQVQKRSRGLSVMLVDLREAVGNGIEVRPIRTMINNETSELIIENLEVPVENLIGEEGRGFSHILDGMNAERILIAAECVGDGRWFIRKASARASDRVVFGRAIGQNQGVQFPIARAHVSVEAADLMRWRACELFDQNAACGPEANMAKLLAADASWEAANVAMQTFGGYGITTDYGIERKFRETRLYQLAPISTNLVLSYVGEHVLGMPRSY